jgi:hypothetical protein
MADNSGEQDHSGEQVCQRCWSIPADVVFEKAGTRIYVCKRCARKGGDRCYSSLVLGHGYTCSPVREDG